MPAGEFSEMTDDSAGESADTRSSLAARDAKNKKSRFEQPPQDWRVQAATMANSPYFQVAICAVIAMNALVLALETDFGSWPYWYIIDNIFLVIFLAELALRLLVDGFREYFARLSNMLDASIVVLGILEGWILPLVLEEEGENAKGSLALRAAMKFCRLLRLVRLLRAVKMVKKLNDYAQALAAIVGPFLLVISILFGFTLFNAIILTQVLGDPGYEELRLRQQVEADGEITPNFKDVSTTFFTLFRVITADNWIGVAQPIILQEGIWWAIYFAGFIIFCSWVMISILTAVASDNVISATSDRLELEAREAERRHKEFLNLVKESFIEADEDGNGLLDRKEFELLLEEMNLTEMLVQLDIPVKKEDLYKTWDMLDVTGSGQLTIDEFVDGLAFLNETSVSTKHIVNVDYQIRKIAHHLSGDFEELKETIGKRRAWQAPQLEQMLQHDLVAQQQTELLRLWRKWAVEEKPSTFSLELKEAALAEDLRSSSFAASHLSLR